MSDLGNKAVLSKNLRDIMEKRQVTRSQICADLGFVYSTFSDWYNGKKYPRIDKIEMMANYFGIMKSDLIENKSKVSPLPSDAYPYNPTHRIPILGRISAGMPLYADENIEGYISTELNHGGEYFALRVHGNSMNAAYIIDGQIIAVRRQDIVENGEIAVVMVGDDEATVKRFYRDGDIVTLEPQSLDPDYRVQIYNLKNTTVRVLGKVVQSVISY